MTDTFLHQDKTLPPDEAANGKAPDCERCARRMWLCKVQRTLSDTDIAWQREYECKSCGNITVLRATEPLCKVG